ncbi:DNA polymerase IV [Patescibacteria group bacterium]|nr:DNA polymerase IV [Patescibacteria group bacterium]
MKLKLGKNDLFNFPQSRKLIMHIDMNSYFATCEQQANPAWRGRPLGVCSYLHPKGTIIAASKEAKEIGIGLGTKVWEAKLKYPGIVLVRDDPTKYRVITERINNIFADYTDEIDKYSIDESFLKFKLKNKNCKLQDDVGAGLPRPGDEYGNAEVYEHDEVDDVVNIAKNIKQRIKLEVGDWLTCSVGVAPTKFLAKTGSDFKKPDGLTVIDEKNVDEILGQLELVDIWGISWGLKRQLNALGIFQPLDIKYAKPSFLLKKMGKVGYFLWSRLNGLEIDQMIVNKEEKRKSIGHSYTLLRKTASKDELARILMKLCEKMGRRLRKRGKTAQVCWVGWRYTFGGGFARQEKMDRTTDDSWEIFRHVYGHLAGRVLHDQVSKVFVSVCGLETKKLQLCFFDDVLKKDRITRSMDKINDKYGEFTVVRGALNEWSEQISDRVAFGN